VPKPIKLLEDIGNGGNGALIRSTVMLRTNDQEFILMGNRRRLTNCGFIFRAHPGGHRFTAQR